MNCFHKFKFKTEATGKPTHAYMDGEELKFLTHAHVDWSLTEIPTVTLTFLATNIEMDIEDGQAEVKKE